MPVVDHHGLGENRTQRNQVGDVRAVGESALHEPDIGFHFRIGQLMEIVERSMGRQDHHLDAVVFDDLLVLLGVQAIAAAVGPAENADGAGRGLDQLLRRQDARGQQCQQRQP